MSHLLSSESHKGKAVNKLKVYLQNNDVKIIALGDSQNDLPLLEYADIAIVIPGKNGPNKYLQNGIDNGSFRLADNKWICQCVLFSKMSNFRSSFTSTRYYRNIQFCQYF